MIFAGGCRVYNDLNNKEEDHNVFVLADNFGAAVDQLSNYYGEGNLIKMNMEAFSPDNFLECSKEEYDTLYKSMKDKVIW